MKASKLSGAQKAFELRQSVGGVPVAEVFRKAGISQAAFFNWKKKYGGMPSNEMRCLKWLGAENRRHSSNDGLSPKQFEDNYFSKLDSV